MLEFSSLLAPSSLPSRMPTGDENLHVGSNYQAVAAKFVNICDSKQRDAVCLGRTDLIEAVKALQVKFGQGDADTVSPPALGD